MGEDQPNNPLHGVTLKFILEDLVERHGWPELYQRISINCFQSNPTIKSSLKFLRKTEWARIKVEKLYVADHARIARNKKRNKRREEMRRYRREQEAEEGTQPLATNTSTLPSVGEE